MRLFVLYDRDGTVRSAMKVEVMGESLEHPYGLLGEGEAVLEAKVTAELGKLAPREICERFAVDPQKRRLIARDSSPTPASGRPRRSAKR